MLLIIRMDSSSILIDDLNKLDNTILLNKFKIPLLKRRNRVLEIVDISQAGLSGTIPDPKVIFATALKSCASSIILCHNHPSGEVDPSSEDIALILRLKEAGKLLDLQILNHM